MHGPKLVMPLRGPAGSSCLTVLGLIALAGISSVAARAVGLDRGLDRAEQQRFGHGAGHGPHALLGAHVVVQMANRVGDMRADRAQSERLDGVSMDFLVHQHPLQRVLLKRMVKAVRPMVEVPPRMQQIACGARVAHHEDCVQSRENRIHGFRWGEFYGRPCEVWMIEVRCVAPPRTAGIGAQRVRCVPCEENRGPGARSR